MSAPVIILPVICFDGEGYREQLMLIANAMWGESAVWSETHQCPTIQNYLFYPMHNSDDALRVANFFKMKIDFNGYSEVFASEIDSGIEVSESKDCDALLAIRKAIFKLAITLINQKVTET